MMMIPQDDNPREDSPAIRLCDGDARALDRLVEFGFDAERLRADEPLDAETSRRVDRLMETCARLERYPVEPAHESLVDAALARIDRYERERNSRMKLDSGRAAGPGARRWRTPDFISVAAMFLIIAAVAVPFLNNRSYITTTTPPTGGGATGVDALRLPEAGFSKALDQLFGTGSDGGGDATAAPTDMSGALPPNISGDPWGGEGMILWVPHRTAEDEVVWQPMRVLQLYRVRTNAPASAEN